VKSIALLLASACPLVLASCGADAAGPSEVQGDWRLVSLTRADRSTIVIPDPPRFTVRFGPDGRVAVRADCNVCSGSWSLEGGALLTSGLACTRAFCSSAPLDTQFVAVLEGRSTTREAGGRLVLASGRGRLVLER
jgi:heat shock protein HslJ